MLNAGSLCIVFSRDNGTKRLSDEETKRQGEREKGRKGEGEKGREVPISNFQCPIDFKKYGDGG
jgi:hypothetical protein